MKENVEKNLTVDELADLCGMSTSNLKKVYSMYSVFSTHKYFIKLKIARAIEMLEEGYNVTEISDKLGYTSAHSFSQNFKKITGMSPTQYKSQICKTHR
jgi:AraC-like DNA-binding protein